MGRLGQSFCLVPGCKMSTDDCWAEILKVPKLDHYKRKVCQLHFNESQFTNRQRTRLKYNAIPRPFSIEPISKSNSKTARQLLPKSTSSPILQLQPTINPNFSLKDLRVSIERLQMPAPSRIIPDLPETEEIPLGNVLPPYTPEEELNVCNLCQNHSILPFEHWYSNQTVEKLEELQLFLVTILKLEFKCFENFPFCKLCTARMEELHDMYAVLRVLQLQFEKQTDDLKKDFIKIFLRSQNIPNSSLKNFDPKIIDAVAEKWKRVKGSQTRNQEQQTENIVPGAANEILRTMTLPVHLIIQTAKAAVPTSTVGVNTEHEEEVDSVIDNLNDDGSSQDSFQSEVPMEENCDTDSTNNTDLTDSQLKSSLPSDNDLENCQGQVEAPVASPQLTENNMNNIYSVTDSSVAAAEDCEQITFEEELEDQVLDKQVSLMIRNYKKAIQKIPPVPKKVKIKRKQPVKLRTCPVCNVVRRGITAFQCHMLLHTGERPWKCSDCEKDFVQMAHLLQHQKVIHGYVKNNSAAERDNFVASKSRLYCCSVCGSDDGCTKTRFLRHIKINHVNKEIMDGDIIWFYDCDSPDCRKSFSKQDQLKNHIVTEHSQNDTTMTDCDVCLRVFSSQEILLVHKTSHLNEETEFPCSYCSMVFATEGELNDHVPRHKIQFQLSQFAHLCELCGEGFLTDMILRAHKKKSSSCQIIKSKKPKPIPGKSRDEKKSVKKKSIRKPPSSRKRDIRKRERTCEFCGKTGEPCNIRTHRYIHTHPEGFPCTTCGFVAKCPKYLQNHQIVVHSLVNGQSVNIICEICKRMFAGGRQLKVHQIRHHPEEYLQGRVHCVSCFDLFDTEQLMNTHFQEKHPHKICPVDDCGRKFGVVNYLKNHLRTHTGERPFQCSFCAETFTQDATLTAHVTRRHTKHRAILCKLCTENPGFFERREFYKHASINHPELNALEIMQTNYLKKKFVVHPPRKLK